MHGESFSRLDVVRTLPAAAFEVRLLELFAPARPPARPVLPMPPLMLRGGRAPLWQADAIHRAKNLAQLSRSFADVAAHPSRRWLPAEVVTRARGLSRAYEELGLDHNTQAPVPCAALLTDIASRLIDIFGRSRQIATQICVEPVLLPPDVRRALILTGSELVINALKYGYPTQSGGTICVSLLARPGEVELIVEDDGCGVAETYAPGTGGGLLDQLRVILGATVTRTTGAQGHGFRISTVLPINMVPGGVA